MLRILLADHHVHVPRAFKTMLLERKESASTKKGETYGQEERQEGQEGQEG